MLTCFFFSISAHLSTLDQIKSDKTYPQSEFFKKLELISCSYFIKEKFINKLNIDYFKIKLNNVEPFWDTQNYPVTKQLWAQ